jgi:hypothetical protein
VKTRRDLGVTRLYVAETTWRRALREPGLWTVADVERYLDAVLPPSLASRATVRPMRRDATVTLADFERCDITCYRRRPYRHRVELRLRFALPTTASIVLHEAAHLYRSLVDPQHAHLHDAEFRWNMLHLVRTFHPHPLAHGLLTHQYAQEGIQ